MFVVAYRCNGAWARCFGRRCDSLHGALVTVASRIGRRCIAHWSPLHRALVAVASCIGRRCIAHWSPLHRALVAVASRIGHRCIAHWSPLHRAWVAVPSRIGRRCHSHVQLIYFLRRKREHQRMYSVQYSSAHLEWQIICTK